MGGLRASPSTPLLVCAKDSRTKEEWEKIYTVPLVSKMRNSNSKEQLLALAEEKKQSIAKMIKLSKILKRKIAFCAQGYFLIEMARQTYGLNSIKPHILPNPVPLPKNRELKFSKKPSLLFIGRLDPVKRPWIVFELAKRFPGVDFYIAGKTHVPELIDPIINQYSHLANLKFRGLVGETERNQLIQSSWGLINTSIHEAIPVSFLESLAFGKCIISCQNPDNLTEKYGYYTGEYLGDGYDAGTLDKFSEKIEQLLSNRKQIIEKGTEAKHYVEQNHSFANFEKRLKEIFIAEEII